MQPVAKARQIARVLARDMRRRGTAYQAGSFELADNKGLAGLIGTDLRYLPGKRIAGFVGWGRRRSGLWAERRAQNSGLLMMLAEDGFLRGSFADALARSYVLDGQGIYYDATCLSDLEMLIAEPLTPKETERAAALIANWRKAPITKYAGLPEYVGDLPGKYVLLADQVPGDLSIRFGLAGPEAFQAMLRAAEAEWPEHNILIKVHPAGRGNHFGGLPARARVIRDACHPARLIAGAAAVYTVTSQLGFEALMMGRPVRTFGMPFYAGWGLTEDALPAPDRRGAATLVQLVHAALIRYSRYVNESGEEISVEEHMAAMQSLRPK